MNRSDTPLRWTRVCRIYASRKGATVQEIPRAGNQGLPVRESPGGEERPLGCGPDGSEDEGLPVAEAGCWSRGSSSRNGRVRITCGTPSSWRYATTNRHARFGGSSQGRRSAECNRSLRRRDSVFHRGCAKPRPRRTILEALAAPSAHGRYGSGRIGLDRTGRVPVSDRSTFGGLRQFLTQFEVSGSSTRP